MEIDAQLKRNLIADVENVCDLKLDNSTKIALMRCFEITIGSFAPELKITSLEKQLEESKAEPMKSAEDRPVAYEYWEPKTGHCYVDYVRNSQLETGGEYIERPLYHKQ